MSLIEPRTFSSHPETVALPIGFIDQVARSRSVSEVLNAVARWLPEMIEADRASIALNIDSRYLQLHAIQGNHAVMVDELLPADETLIGRVHRDQTPALVELVHHRHEIDCRILHDSEMSTYMVAPLTSGAECFGTLNVVSKEANRYSESEAIILQCLANWIGSHIRIYRHIEHEQALSETDPMTGLLNRRSFVQVAERVYEDWRDDGLPFIVAVLDLDRFRELNDQFGHAGGDRVLVEFASELRTAVREVDHVARLGGEEFAIILENMHEKNAMTWAQRLTDTIAGIDIAFEDENIQFTVSVGIAAPRLGDEGIDPIVSRAERALTQAKQSGRNQVAIA